MSWNKFKESFEKSNMLFHEKITPNLPENIQNEIKNCYTFTYSQEGKGNNVILSVNGKKFDITKWYTPGITIFDLYERTN